LQRPTATEFMKVLSQLEGRTIKWLPINVVDLVGKVRFDWSRAHEYNLVAKHESLWRKVVRLDLQGRKLTILQNDKRHKTT
jgi:hypothetical protein